MVSDVLTENDEVIKIGQGGLPLVHSQHNFFNTLAHGRSIFESKKHSFESVETGVAEKGRSVTVFFSHRYLPVTATGVKCSEYRGIT